MVQYLRPRDDYTPVTSGSFTAGRFRVSTGTTGWEATDDASPYGTGGLIYTNYGDVATYQCRLTLIDEMSPPLPGTCTITIRGGRGSGAADASPGGNNVVWNLTLFQVDTPVPLTGGNGGVDEVYSNTEDGLVVRTWTFQASDISFWNQLRIKIDVEAQTVDANARNIRIDAIEIATPDFAPLQQLKPISDRSSSNVNTAPFWSKVDEDVRDDSDYIHATVNTAASVRLNLSAPTDTPAAGPYMIHVGCAQINKDGVIVSTSGGNNVILSAEIYQGETLVGTGLGNIPGSSAAPYWALVTTTTTFDVPVTNWSDISIRLYCSASGGSPVNRRGFAVSWVRVFVQNAASDTLAGTIGGTSTATGAFGASRPSASTMSGAGAASVVAGARRPFAGTIAGAATTTANLGLARTLAGAIGGAATATATFNPPGFSFAGSIAGSSTATGAFLANRPLVGSVSGAGAFTGAAGAQRPFAGVIAGAATTSLTTGAHRPMAGAISGTGAVTGALGLARPLAGTIAGAATAEVTFTVPGGRVIVSWFALQIPEPPENGLQGSIAGSATASITTLKTAPMAAVVAGVGSCIGVMKASRPGATATAGAATATASFGHEKPFAGTIGGAATITGAFNITRYLAGAVSGAATITGAFAKTAPLAAAAAGSATAQIIMLANKPGAANMGGAANAVASFTSSADSVSSDWLLRRRRRRA